MTDCVWSGGSEVPVNKATGQQQNIVVQSDRQTDRQTATDELAAQTAFVVVLRIVVRYGDGTGYTVEENRLASSY